MGYFNYQKVAQRAVPMDVLEEMGAQLVGYWAASMVSSTVVDLAVDLVALVVRKFIKRSRIKSKKAEIGPESNSKG